MKKRLAYWDSFSGLVPCKVVGIERFIDPDYTDVFGHLYMVVAVLTVNRGPWRRGEQIVWSPAYIWPRDCVKPKRGTYGRTCIVARYDWRERVASGG